MANMRQRTTQNLFMISLSLPTSQNFIMPEQICTRLFLKQVFKFWWMAHFNKLRFTLR